MLLKPMHLLILKAHTRLKSKTNKDIIYLNV